MNSNETKKEGYLKSSIHPLPLPYDGEMTEDWVPIKLFSGQSKSMEFVWCQQSVLKAGCWPHPPHQHEQEEIGLMIYGEGEVLTPEADDGIESRPFRPGNLSYYPANYLHTNRGVSTIPANYLMMKWHSDLKRQGAQLKFSEYKIFDHLESPASGNGLKTKVLFKGQTNYLKSLNCHTSVLAPGKGYKPHADDYDVVIVLLEGEIETLGKRINPCSVIYYAAGEPHGMHNPGSCEAKYIVFEFHGWPRTAKDKYFRPFFVLLSKVFDPQRWNRKFGQLTSRA